jgi:hypothetical protein
MSALGHKLTLCSAKGHIRFTPNSDRKSGFPHKVLRSKRKSIVRAAPENVITFVGCQVFLGIVLSPLHGGPGQLPRPSSVWSCLDHP